VEDIFETDENQFFIYHDNAIGNYQGTNNIYSVPESFIETQQKYIKKLEEENQKIINENRQLKTELAEIKKKK